MKPRVFLAVLAALLLVAGTAPAHATPPEDVVSLTLVLRPQGPGTQPMTYAADDVRVGPGPELRGACGGECVDYAHPSVDIDPATSTISVMIPGNEHQLTDAELLIVSDHIAGFPSVASARTRMVDTRRAEVMSDGARLTWTSYTAASATTVTFPYRATEPAAPTPPDPSPEPSLTLSPARPPQPPLPAERDEALTTSPIAEAGTLGRPPTSPEPSRAPTAEAAAPVVVEPTFAG